MESFTKQDQEITGNFLNFYTDLIENHPETLQYSISEKIILDWFGKTIKGEKNVTTHLKENTKFIHIFEHFQPVIKIGHRDTHIIDLPKEEKPLSLTELNVEEEEETNGIKISPKNTPSSSHIFEQGQGDGLHNCDLPISPMKRFKKSNSLEEIEKKTLKSNTLRFLMAEGFIEFRKKSLKKLQKETMWKRPCKLEIAYSTVNNKDFTIHLIIYSNEMKCRRNLLKDFESTPTDD